MVSLGEAAEAVRALSKQVTQEPTAQSSRNAANALGDVARAIEGLSYRIEAIELIVSTLGHKQGLTASQVQREGVAPLHPSPQAAAFRHDTISAHLERILALANT